MEARHLKNVIDNLKIKRTFTGLLATVIEIDGVRSTHGWSVHAALCSVPGIMIYRNPHNGEEIENQRRELCHFQ